MDQKGLFSITVDCSFFTFLLHPLGFNFNPLILIMCLLGITPDTWHCIKIEVELFSADVVKPEIHHEKELVEAGSDENILGFPGIFLGAGICSIMFCLMSLSNQTITVHRYPCSLCWVQFHLALCALKQALRDFSVVIPNRFFPCCIRLESAFPEDFLYLAWSHLA